MGGSIILANEFDQNVFAAAFKPSPLTAAEEDALAQRDEDIETVVHYETGLQPSRFYARQPLSAGPSDVQIEAYNERYGELEAMYAQGRGQDVEALAADYRHRIAQEASTVLEPLMPIHICGLIEQETWTAEQAAVMLSGFKAHPRALEFCWKEQEFHPSARMVADTVEAMRSMPNPPTDIRSILPIGETVLWARRQDVLVSQTLEQAFDEKGRPHRQSKSPLKRLDAENQRLKEENLRLKAALKKRKFEGKVQLQAALAILAGAWDDKGPKEFSPNQIGVLSTRLGDSHLPIYRTTLKRHIEAGVEYLNDGRFY